MKYYLFSDGRVRGPFAPEELMGVQGFTEETLVCPENRPGSQKGDWQPARGLGELFAAIRGSALGSAGGGAAARLSLTEAIAPAGKLAEFERRIDALKNQLEAAASGLRDESLRREREVRRLEEAGAANAGGSRQLEARLAGLENGLADLKKRLEEQSRRQSSAASAPEPRNGIDNELTAKVAELAARVSSFKKESLDSAAKVERSLMEAVERQCRQMEELRRDVESLKGRAPDPSAEVAPAPPIPPATIPALPAASEPPAPPPPEIEAPLVEASPAGDAPRIELQFPGAPQKPESKTVLIVDDDESVLNLLEIFIKRDGFGIDTATSGDEALAKLDGKPDAVILDLMLPGGSSGFEVLKQMRRRPGPPPPVIVVSAYGHSKEVEAVKKDPHVALFLSKPINQAKLLSGLHKLLNTQPAAPPKPVSA